MLKNILRPLLRTDISHVCQRTSFHSQTPRWRQYTAAVLREFNKPLKIERLDSPLAKLNSQQVRIGVHYCSLNYTDVKTFEGFTNCELLLPIVPGSEFSGEILEVGDDSDGFKVGDRVVALTDVVSRNGGGGLATEVVVDKLSCWQLSQVSLKNAAILPYGHGTALLAFTKYAPIDEDDIVIVMAGPGGLGLGAIEVAASVYKAKVIAICDTADSGVLIRSEGAFQAICIKEGHNNVYKFLRNAMGDKKAAVIYDAVGQGNLHIYQDFVCPKRGKLISVYPLFDKESFKRDVPTVEIKKKYKLKTEFNQAIEDRVRHVDLFAFRKEDTSYYRQIIDDTFTLYEDELISAYVSKVFQLDQIAEAIEFIQNKECTGKVLIEVKEQPTKAVKREKGDDDDD